MRSLKIGYLLVAICATIGMVIGLMMGVSEVYSNLHHFILWPFLDAFFLGVVTILGNLIKGGLAFGLASLLPATIIAGVLYLLRGK